MSLIETPTPEAPKPMLLEDYVKARLNIGENLYMDCIMTISKFLPAEGQHAIAKSISTAGPAMKALEDYFTAHGVHEEAPRLMIFKD